MKKNILTLLAKTILIGIFFISTVECSWSMMRLKNCEDMIRLGRSYGKKNFSSKGRQIRPKISLEPLAFSHLALMHKWFNSPHVQAFYSLRSWTEEEVYKKLTPYIEGEQPIKGYIIKTDEEKVGYIQSCNVIDYPWVGADLPSSVVTSALSFDLFIGESKFVGKGYGEHIINNFLEKMVWPSFDYCVVDPDVRNLPSIQCLKKCGFTVYQEIHGKDALYQDKRYFLMILKKSIDLNE